MKICLAGISGARYAEKYYEKCQFRLESFYKIPKWCMPSIKECELFLLDSGAFTFMNDIKKKNKNINFDEYVDKYIKFINDNDIKYFFELDIDSIVGIDEVERLRKKIELGTGKKCIPVWHKSRGKEYFIKMCQDYDYVAIGGIVTKEITPEEYKYFKWFIDTAHSYGCKIHGLGFTSTKLLQYYNFDSVDSTSWTSGSKFAVMYYFNGKKIIKIDTNKRRVRNDIPTSGINTHNFLEWCKFQKYAELHY